MHPGWTPVSGCKAGHSSLISESVLRLFIFFMSLGMCCVYWEHSSFD